MKEPAPGTLAKYGLSLEEWRAMLGPCCPICGRGWDIVRPVIDHEHRAGWANLPPEERKRFVRGCPCLGCNFRVLVRGLTAKKALGAYRYLRAYEKRRP